MLRPHKHCYFYTDLGPAKLGANPLSAEQARDLNIVYSKR